MCINHTNRNAFLCRVSATVHCRGINQSHQFFNWAATFPHNSVHIGWKFSKAFFYLFHQKEADGKDIIPLRAHTRWYCVHLQCLVVISGKLTQTFTNKGLPQYVLDMVDGKKGNREVLQNDSVVKLDPLMTHSHSCFVFLPQMVAIHCIYVMTCSITRFTKTKPNPNVNLNVTFDP